MSCAAYARSIEKARRVEELQKPGKVVIMAGDGINDAPVLAGADCGIAIGTGTDIAIEAADVTISGGDLGSMTRAVRLSRGIFRKIKQILAWAYAYNILAIPAVVLGLLHPLIGVAAMTFSSVSVIKNARLLEKVDQG